MTKRRKTAHRADAKLTVWLRTVLESGEDFFDNLPEKLMLLDEWGKRRNVERCPTAMQFLRTQWELYSEEVMTHFVQRFPGQRPWAFWQWSSPEPREAEVFGDGSNAEQQKQKDLALFLLHNLLSRAEQTALEKQISELERLRIGDRPIAGEKPTSRDLSARCPTGLLPNRRQPGR